MLGRDNSLPAHLVRFLGLSSSQVQSIEGRIAQYATEYRRRRDRMVQVSRDIRSDFAQSAPRAATLGRGYGELESIRRELAAREVELQRGNATLLNAEQQRKLAGLKGDTSLALAYLGAWRFGLFAPTQSTPASRQSFPSIRFLYPDGSSSSSSSGALLSVVREDSDEPVATTQPLDSIYRACVDGPDYIVEIVFETVRWPAGLVDYLDLTPEQFSELHLNVYRFETSREGMVKEIGLLNDEIGKETQKGDLDPDRLGSHYLGIENRCRHEQPLVREFHELQLRVLQPDQRRLLTPLEKLSETADLFSAASTWFLPQPAPGPTEVFNGTRISGGYFFGPEASDAGLEISAKLVNYLQLTPAQIQGVQRLFRQYATEYLARRQRLIQVSREIQSEIGLASPQPLALGGGYREIESIRRGLAAREEDLRRAIAELLTSDQRRRVAELKDTDSLRDPYYDALGLTLLAPPASPPASRESYANIRVSSNSSSVTYGTFLPAFAFALDPDSAPFGSIYRACVGGRDYTVD